MTTHSYSLRSRVSSSSLSTKTPTQSPLNKPVKSPRKGTAPTPILQLKHVIGTTTTNPSGLSCCTSINAYAYCAGSVAVLATVNAENLVDHRYFKARPTAVPINQIVSFYDSPSTPGTPTRRRTILGSRKPHEEHGGGTFSRDWPDESGANTWSARERIKTASCVSISPDGNTLAVGEVGYNPRVLLFSTATNMSSDIPMSIMTDHTIGVRSVAFSPDSRYLATLGDVNDGFLYIWQVNTKTGMVRLHSSNKCTTNVCDMTWCGNNVITVGTRHIKIWQVSSNTSASLARKTRLRHEENTPNSMPKPLQGRNCLLGSFVDATFTAVVAVSEDQAVVCADDGHICLLNLKHGKTELNAIDRAEAPIAALAVRQNPVRIVWAGGGGHLEEKDIGNTSLNEHLEPLATPLDVKRRCMMSRQSLLRQSLGLGPPKRATTVAIGCLDDKAVCVDAESMVRVMNIDTYDLVPDVSSISSHKCAVKGVQRLYKESGLGSFFTWAVDGEVRFWNSDAVLNQVATIKLDDTLETDNATANELKAVRCAPSGKMIITGDQYGVVKVVDTKTWTTLQTVRAHSAEINDIDMHEPTRMIATCSRDRMIQIFRSCNDDIELIQTLDDHISSISQVLFSQNGKRLLSCSADRTVVVRDRVEGEIGRESMSAFIPTRTVTLKATPLSMGFLPDQIDTLVVSTTDRHVMQLDMTSGAIITSFKASDRGSDDTVTMSSISMSRSKGVDKRHLLAGLSTVDKSVRIYDLEKGILLGRDSGHTEGISDIIMFDEDSINTPSAQTTIVSTGLDSTIMIWSVCLGGHISIVPQQDLAHTQVSENKSEETASKNSPALLPPLRKILSKVDVAEFVRQSSPTREASPGGLRRKTSRLALATSIAEADEIVCFDSPVQSPQIEKADPENRSPSPPSKSVARLKIQRSRPELTRTVNMKHGGSTPSPSPPNSAVSVSAAPKQNARANNSRLRRPPSVPNDLRAQVVAQGRRQSISSMNELGSIAVATDQTCRMLRTYRKRLLASHEISDLNNIEAELAALSEVIKQKQSSTNTNDQEGQMKVTRGKMDDVEMTRLSDLLDKTSVS